MSEQNPNEQIPAQAELTEESLENVSGGHSDGGCLHPVGTPPYFPEPD